MVVSGILDVWTMGVPSSGSTTVIGWRFWIKTFEVVSISISLEWFGRTNYENGSVISSFILRDGKFSSWKMTSLDRMICLFSIL